MLEQCLLDALSLALQLVQLDPSTHKIDPGTGNICLEHTLAKKRLEEVYDEYLMVRGLVVGGNYMMELYSNVDGGWTILVTSVNGCSFILASGDQLEDLRDRAGRGI